jgi:hypothetical protein
MTSDRPPNKVFLVFAEVGGSEKLQRQGYAGGFVTVIVRARDIRTAIDAAEQALADDDYQVADFDKVLLFERDEWSEDAEVRSAALQTAQDGEIRYTPFNVWGH